MDKIPFEDGTLVKEAYVIINGEEHEVIPEEYTGETPLSAHNLNKMQDNIEKSINEEALIKYLEIQGNSIQKTRSGKNKFIPLQDGNNSGIAITKNEDGTYNITGTATANIEHVAFVDLDESEIENGETYILSSNKTLPAGLTSRVEMYKGSAWLRAFVPNISATIPTNTGTANTVEATRVRFGIFITSGTTLNIQNLGFQLEKGTTATEYEQYGASPSVEHPSEIKSVGDNINCIPTSIEEWEQGTIGTDGTLTNSTTRIRTKDYYPINGGVKYSTTLKGGTNYVYGNIHYYNSNKGWIGNQYDLSGNVDTDFTELTFTPPTNTKYFKIFLKKTNNSTILPEEIPTIKPKLEKGTVTQYSPYGQGSIEIKQDNGLETTDGNYKTQTKILYTQKPFRSIGDVRDRFVKENGVWYEKHLVKRIESYNGESITTEYMSSVGGLETGATVDYILATPELIECTAEQVETLNDIYSAYGEGLTNITCNNEIEPVIEIIKETKETVQSHNDKAISALLERVAQLEETIATMQEEGTL